MYKLGLPYKRTVYYLIQENPTISAMAKHFTVLEVKAELDQLLCGLLSTLGMLELVRSEPSVMRPLFVHTTTSAMMADVVYNVFTITKWQ